MKPEQIEQIKLFDYIKSQPDLNLYCFSIANERKVTPQHGFILQRMGLRAGVSDVFVAIPRDTFHGLFIELKAGKNKMSPEQKKFFADMTSQGYLAVCAVGYEAARQIIETYMALEKSS